MPHTKLDEILANIQSLQLDLEQELEKILEEKRVSFQYTLNKGKVRFKKQIRTLQRQQKTALYKYFKDAQIRSILSAPIVYSVIIPLIFLDISVTIYQQLCFRLYGIPRVVRSNYLVIDRQHLAYLNFIEKINCMYCGYGNGLVAYVREIIARTEQYWCPIKHAKKVLDAHQLTENFVDYGDAQAYRNKLKILRKDVSDNLSKNA